MCEFCHQDILRYTKNPDLPIGQVRLSTMLNDAVKIGDNDVMRDLIGPVPIIALYMEQSGGPTLMISTFSHL